MTVKLHEVKLKVVRIARAEKTGKRSGMVDADVLMSRTEKLLLRITIGSCVNSFSLYAPG